MVNREIAENIVSANRHLQVLEEKWKKGGKKNESV